MICNQYLKKKLPFPLPGVMFRWLGLNIIIRTKIIKLSDFSSYIGFLDLTFGQSNPCLNHHLDTNKIFFKTDHNVVSMLIIFFAASINRLSIIHKVYCVKNQSASY